jgi:hypothetical protein
MSDPVTNLSAQKLGTRRTPTSEGYYQDMVDKVPGPLPGTGKCSVNLSGSHWPEFL